MKHKVWMVMAALALAAAAAAQTPPAALERVVIEQQAQAVKDRVKVVEWTQAAPAVHEMRMAVQGKITKGAPYTADTVTESVHALADGNRIVRRTTSHVSRDSEGRTRTEETGAQGVQMVSISDPVSGETWMLDPQTRTASRGGVFVVSAKGAVVGGAGVSKFEWTTGEGHDMVGAVRREPVPPPPPLPHASSPAGVAGGLVRLKEAPGHEGEVTREDLGQQAIEGLTATGTRTTTVIPAGAIGNEHAIRIVSEQWFSPDLQLLVMTKFSDPRSGETTFRLTNVTRAEPDRSLFTVPPDYTVKESMIKRESR